MRRLLCGKTAHQALQRASCTLRQADAERISGDFAPRAPASVPRTWADPDGRAGSTALRSAAREPPALHSTRAHGAGIAAISDVEGAGSTETSTLNKLSSPTQGLGWYKVHRERHCNGTEACVAWPEPDSNLMKKSMIGWCVVLLKRYLGIVWGGVSGGALFY